MTAPIPYPEFDALSPELQEAITSRASLNVYRMVAHSPGLAPAFYTMASDIFVNNSLPPDWRELAILRVGHAYAAIYETHHHTNIGKAVGMSDAALIAAQTGERTGLTAEETAVVEITEQLLNNHTLDDAGRAAALSVLTVTQLADLVLTVGFYQLVCNFLNTFHVMPEDGQPQP
ncbi:carboxymuconolactone decarboxylase family protein [Nocardia sp. CA-151230]|uniref:carboxymuconolactone decarboxylase family protein n=1 Tax=Nocardia sp. CA-151230 TaxID=3239982 RepID=UPI003D8F9355